jgi:hypothetical protein
MRTTIKRYAMWLFFRRLLPSVAVAALFRTFRLRSV